MKLLKRLACGLLCISLLFGNCANFAFAEDNAVSESESEIPSEAKVIYNFECKEEKMSLEKTAVITETPVAFYQGYTNQFLISSNTFEAFEYGTLFVRSKGAASGVTYKQSAYGNNGEPYDGKDGRDYWMSFDITTGATVYMVDRENMGWPARPDDWFYAGSIGGRGVYGKHFNAGEEVNVPCYGWDESWDKEADRLFMDPSYFVVSWDNDITLKSFTHTIDSGKVTAVDGFNVIDEGGEYNIELEYDKDGYNITTAIEPLDPQATVEASMAESFKVECGAPQSITYTVTSEAKDVTGTYTVNYTVNAKKNVAITVNPEIEAFGANEALTDIYLADSYAGENELSEVPIASYDENGYFKCAKYKIVYNQNGSEKTAYVDYADIYTYLNNYSVSSIVVSEWNYTDENMYTVNKGMDFFTDGDSFGVTGSAYDKAGHIMTSAQFAPGKVSADSFSDSASADEFKNWLLDDNNYMYEMTSEHDCVVYVAFTQTKARNHTKFLADGWTFNDYSGVTIPTEALLDEFKDEASPKWWMADPSYNFNGNPYLLVKNQYTTEAATVSRNYFYIWSKEVKAGESVQIPVGGSAFSSTSDQNAPKVLINWQTNELRDDVSGVITCGKRRILIDNSIETRPLPIMIASVGDELCYEGNNGATAEFSQNVISILPCVIEVVIKSEAGSKAFYTIDVKEQPEITSVNVSPIRDKFVSNTGNNKIELSPYIAGEYYKATKSRQVFERDEDGILQPVYGEDGKYLFEKVEINIRNAFYRDRANHRYAHVGEGLKNMQYFWIPSNDATGRRKNVYTSENNTYAANNGGEEKVWQFENEDGTVEELGYLEMASRYQDYIVGDNEYFNFTANDSGVVYVALEEESANFTVANGWKKMTVDVPIPEGHAGWNSVEVDVTNPYYPYQLGKIQYDGHATEYHVFDNIYYKTFEADEVVVIPTSGIASSDVMAVMVGWEDFITEDAGGTLSYGDNKMRIRNSREKYTVHVYEESDINLSFVPSYEYARCTFSDSEVKLSELLKTVLLDVVNAFGVARTFEIEFIEGDLGEKKIYNLDTASDYAIYESENGDAYNTDKGFIKFSEGWYMLEDNLELGVSAYYSDRLTHKFTKENTSEMFAGATYIRRPKKSLDYGNMGLSRTSAFYADERFNGKTGNSFWLSFGVSSAAEVYVGVPGDGIWPNKPDDWQEADVKLAGCTKVYMKSYSRGDCVEIPSMGWSSDWDSDRSSWDLPVYVVCWQ